MAGGRAIFIADLHIEPGKDETARKFAAFLDTLAPGTSLFVLGDLFAYWFEYGDAIFSDFFGTLCALGRTASRGVEISLLRGNRDFMMGAFFERRVGARVIGDSAEVELGGKRILLTHGDLLCTLDRSYLIFRKIIRSRPIIALASALPPAVTGRLVRALRKRTARAASKKPPDVFEPQEKALKKMLADHDAVIFAHTHRKSDKTIDVGGAPKRAIGLGAWGETFEHLVFEDGEFRFEIFQT